MGSGLLRIDGPELAGSGGRNRPFDDEAEDCAGAQPFTWALVSQVVQKHQDLPSREGSRHIRRQPNNAGCEWPARKPEESSAIVHHINIAEIEQRVPEGHSCIAE